MTVTFGDSHEAQWLSETSRCGFYICSKNAVFLEATQNEGKIVFRF
jgi:hypothetical protein